MITEFLLARIAEDEAYARDIPGRSAFVPTPADEEIATAYPGSYDRMLAECAAKRRIIEIHKSWPVLVERPPLIVEEVTDPIMGAALSVRQEIEWMTETRYREQFGSEPPTTPMLKAMASVYAGHPDFREEWRA